MRKNYVLPWKIGLLALAIGVALSEGRSFRANDGVVPTDDAYDSPDLEMDDGGRNTGSSLGADREDDLEQSQSEGNADRLGQDYNDDSDELPDIISEDVAEKRPDESVLATKKDEMCDPDDATPYCLCQRSCAPGLIFTVSPCQCTDTQAQKNAGDVPTMGYSGIQPPLLSSQQSPALSSSPFFPTAADGQVDCLGLGNLDHPACSCKRACTPGVPLSLDPCMCMDMVNQADQQAMGFPLQPQPAQFSYPDFVDYSQYSQYPQTAAAFSSPYSGSFVAADSPSDTSSCARACLPYAMQQQSPCQCDFNVRSDAFQSPVQNYQTPFTPYGGDSGQQFGYNPFQPGHMAGGSPGSRPAWDRQNASRTSGWHKTRRPETSIGLYLGCYHDKKPNRDLKLNVAVHKLTPDACVNRCREKKKRFAAVQNGYLCFCGSRFGRYKRGKDEECASKCVGDPTKYCGGPWLNSVYSTDGQLYSPRQFSFTSKDPYDEVEAEKNGRKPKGRGSADKSQSKKPAKGKGERDKRRSEPKAPSVKAEKTAHDSNKGKKGKPRPAPVDDSKAKKGKKLSGRTSIMLKPGSTRSKALESASSPSDMAELLVLHDEGGKNQLTKQKAALQENTKVVAPSKSNLKAAEHKSPIIAGASAGAGKVITQYAPAKLSKTGLASVAKVVRRPIAQSGRVQRNSHLSAPLPSSAGSKDADADDGDDDSDSDNR